MFLIIHTCCFKWIIRQRVSKVKKPTTIQDNFDFEVRVHLNKSKCINLTVSFFSLSWKKCIALIWWINLMSNCSWHILVNVYLIVSQALLLIHILTFVLAIVKVQSIILKKFFKSSLVCLIASKLGTECALILQDFTENVFSLYEWIIFERDEKQQKILQSLIFSYLIILILSSLHHITF